MTEKQDNIGALLGSVQSSDKQLEKIIILAVAYGYHAAQCGSTLRVAQAEVLLALGRAQKPQEHRIVCTNKLTWGPCPQCVTHMDCGSWQACMKYPPRGEQ